MRSPRKILIIGQCTLHWGRMEFGNIGNYYIVEPLIRLLHEVFPGVELRTTMQLSDRFCREERVTCIPMEFYYSWSGIDLEQARSELDLARRIGQSQTVVETTPYIEEVLNADLVIDFSGDIWGDNADFLGPDRFEVGLCKDRVAQLLGKPTAMIAGSPGPFSRADLMEFTREVYEGFNLVANREAISARLLFDSGFDLSRTVDCACPAFLFEPRADALTATVRTEMRATARGKPVVGFVVCGWNFRTGPFDRWPREDHEFEVFVQAVGRLTEKLDAAVFLFSHSNGFDVPPSPFRLKHGRDFPIAQRIFELATSRFPAATIGCLDGIYSPAQTKEIIGGMDMLVSGRVHGAVAGLSQAIPTVIIEYGHEPKAHKLRGFAEVASVEDLVANPDDTLFDTIERCFYERAAIHDRLKARLPEAFTLVRQNVRLLEGLL